MTSEATEHAPSFGSMEDASLARGNIEHVLPLGDDTLASFIHAQYLNEPEHPRCPYLPSQQHITIEPSGDSSMSPSTLSLQTTSGASSSGRLTMEGSHNSSLARHVPSEHTYKVMPRRLTKEQLMALGGLPVSEHRHHAKSHWFCTVI